MKKLLVIERCIDCPFLDYSYYDYANECGKVTVGPFDSNRNVEDHNTIPDWCPLEETELPLTI